MKDRYMKKLVLIFLIILSQIAFSQWESLDGPYGGEVTALAYNPYSNYVYAAVNYYSCFFVSKNQGKSWERLNIPRTFGINNILFKNDSMLYIISATSVFKSTDYGTTWTLISQNDSWYITSSAIDKHGNLYVNNYNHTFYKSTDDGSTWKDFSKSIQNLASIFVSRNDDIYALSREPMGKLYKNTDNELSFQMVKDSIYCSYLANYYSPFAENSKGYIYVGTWTNSILRSTDNGTTWSQIKIKSYPIDQIADIYIDGKDKIYLTMSNYGIYMSVDDGETWTSSCKNIANPSILNYITDDDQNVYVGSVGDGVHISSDGGYNWIKSVDGMNGTTIMCFAEARNGDIYTGTESSGLFRYKTKDKLWETFSKDSNYFGGVNTVVIDKNDWIYIGTNSTGVFFSSDKGNIPSSVLLFKNLSLIHISEPTRPY